MSDPVHYFYEENLCVDESLSEDQYSSALTCTEMYSQAVVTDGTQSFENDNTSFSDHAVKRSRSSHTTSSQSVLRDTLYQSKSGYEPSLDSLVASNHTRRRVKTQSQTQIESDDFSYFSQDQPSTLNLKDEDSYLNYIRSPIVSINDIAASSRLRPFQSLVSVDMSALSIDGLPSTPHNKRHAKADNRISNESSACNVDEISFDTFFEDRKKRPDNTQEHTHIHTYANDFSQSQSQSQTQMTQSQRSPQRAAFATRLISPSVMEATVRLFYGTESKQTPNDVDSDQYFLSQFNADLLLSSRRNPLSKLVKHAVRASDVSELLPLDTSITSVQAENPNCSAFFSALLIPSNFAELSSNGPLNTSAIESGMSQTDLNKLTEWIKVFHDPLGKTASTYGRITNHPHALQSVYQHLVSMQSQYNHGVKRKHRASDNNTQLTPVSPAHTSATNTDVVNISKISSGDIRTMLLNIYNTSNNESLVELFEFIYNIHAISVTHDPVNKEIIITMTLPVHISVSSVVNHEASVCQHTSSKILPLSAFLTTDAKIGYDVTHFDLCAPSTHKFVSIVENIGIKKALPVPEITYNRNSNSNNDNNNNERSRKCRRKLSATSMSLELLDVMLVQERLHAIDLLYVSEHSGLNCRMRAILLDWLSEVCHEFLLTRDTYHLSVALLDRYLSKLGVVLRKKKAQGIEILPDRNLIQDQMTRRHMASPRKSKSTVVISNGVATTITDNDMFGFDEDDDSSPFSKNQSEKARKQAESAPFMFNNLDLRLVPAVDRESLQLLGITCLSIAAKMEEIHPPSRRDLIITTDSAYNIQEMDHLEMVLLNILEWRLHAPTPFNCAKQQLSTLLVHIVDQHQRVNDCSLQEVEVLIPNGVDANIRMFNRNGSNKHVYGGNVALPSSNSTSSNTMHDIASNVDADVLQSLSQGTESSGTSVVSVSILRPDSDAFSADMKAVIVYPSEPHRVEQEQKAATTVMSKSDEVDSAFACFDNLDDDFEPLKSELNSSVNTTVGSINTSSLSHSMSVTTNFELEQDKNTFYTYTNSQSSTSTNSLSQFQTNKTTELPDYVFSMLDSPTNTQEDQQQQQHQQQQQELDITATPQRSNSVMLRRVAEGTRTLKTKVGSSDVACIGAIGGVRKQWLDTDFQSYAKSPTYAYLNGVPTSSPDLSPQARIVPPVAFLASHRFSRLMELLDVALLDSEHAFFMPSTFSAAAISIIYPESRVVLPHIFDSPALSPALLFLARFLSLPFQGQGLPTRPYYDVMINEREMYTRQTHNTANLTIVNEILTYPLRFSFLLTPTLVEMWKNSSVNNVIYKQY